jgi:hypothetical protein|tara:strand:- start:831 stop:1202 length:372 start_codon:yes stop_codon:yes gene_type:complete
MDTDMPQLTEIEFDQLKKDYTEAIPEGDAIKAQLKSFNKEQKERHAKIYQYMRENNLMTADLGGVTFEREEKTTVPSVSMKTLEEIVEDPAIVEQYKRDYANTKESLKVRKPKRQRTETPSTE